MKIPNSYLTPNILSSKAYSNKANSTQASFSAELSIEETQKAKALSPKEEMEIFKKEFYDEISRIKTHPTVINVAINISEDAFVKMKEDPEYKQQILNLIKRDVGDSYAPRNTSLLLTIGSSLNEYRGDGWPVIADSEFGLRSQNSFYKKTNTNKNKYKELHEEYIQKSFVEKQYLKKLNEKRENEEDRVSDLLRSEVEKAYDSQIMFL